MRGHIVWAILAVTTLAVLAFSLPLAVVIDREFEGQALLRLERSAILAARDVPAAWRPGQPLELDYPPAGNRLAVYDAASTLVVGQGPAVGDPAVVAALADRIGESESQDSYVIAVPLTDVGVVIGVLRAEQRLAVTDRRIRAAWAAMGLLAAVVIGASVLVARRLAWRLVGPVEALRAHATRLGTDEPRPPFERCGVAEIDDVAAALDAAALRVDASVDGERVFSAEVSHQLRTPITGLRLLIETELVAPRADRTELLHDAAGAVARLADIVEGLLLLSRGRPVDRVRLDVAAVLREAERRWRPRSIATGRVLEVQILRGAESTPIVASPSALGHVLDVLIDNAFGHGVGTVSVRCEPVGTGVALRVSDEGCLDGSNPARALLTQGRGEQANPLNLTAAGRIGLRMARRLATAEGGELVCSCDRPTSFSLLLAPATPSRPTDAVAEN